MRAAWPWSWSWRRRLGVSACGDDDGGGDSLEIGSPEQAQEAVAAVADMASDAGSAMFTLDVTTADDSLR